MRKIKNKKLRKNIRRIQVAIDMMLCATTIFMIVWIGVSFIDVNMHNIPYAPNAYVYQPWNFFVLLVEYVYETTGILL